MAVVNKVPYKQFYITVQVKAERGAMNRFKVMGSIRPVQNETTVMRSWLEINHFATENEAYEYGLQNCRAWIDEHARRSADV